MIAYNNDTITALATPNGIGAIGVIRLSGPTAIQITDSVFKGKKLEKQPSHTIHYGTIRNDKDHIIDEVLVSLFKAPHSYTREDVIEISCHGSPYIQQQLLQLLVQKGARFAEPGEFTMRAFLNGQLDLSQAEAVADVIASQSEAAHSVAIRQLRGGFSDDLTKLREELITFASLIELELDFGEEDVEFANRAELRVLVVRIQTYISALMQSFSLGNAIKNGVSTVIVGRPNAGKSTLLNALLNEDRAIVSDIAGTTRDTIEEILNINGVQFRLIDTAGIREANDMIEAIGVEKTFEKVKNAAILVYVADCMAMSVAEIQTEIQRLIANVNDVQVCVILNKIDTIPNETNQKTMQSEASVSFPETWKSVFISATQKTDIERIRQDIYDISIGGKLQESNTIVSNARHFDALQRARAALDDVLRGMDGGITADFVAMDIRRSLYELGTITGQVGVDDLLENIFSKFCIGK